MGLSLALLLSGRRQVANFVGQWVPTILVMGLYNKLLKQHGHDRSALEGAAPAPSVVHRTSEPCARWQRACTLATV